MMSSTSYSGSCIGWILVLEYCKFPRFHDVSNENHLSIVMSRILNDIHPMRSLGLFIDRVYSIALPSSVIVFMKPANCR